MHMGVVEKRSLTLLDVLANCPKPCSCPQYQSLPVWCVVCPWCLVWNCPCDRCSCSPIHFDFWILVVPVGRLHRIYRLAIALRCCHVHQLDSAGMDSAVCRVFVIDFAVCHFVYCGSFLDSTQIDCDYVVVDYFFLWTVSENSNGLDYRCVPAGGLFLLVRDRDRDRDATRLSLLRLRLSLDGLDETLTRRRRSLLSWCRCRGAGDEERLLDFRRFAGGPRRFLDVDLDLEFRLLRGLRETLLDEPIFTGIFRNLFCGKPRGILADDVCETTSWMMRFQTS